jgi:beta-glucosidase
MIDRREMVGASLALAFAPWAHAAAKRSGPAFPTGFLWGAATSGHQTEGNNINADIWIAENVDPTVYTEKSGDACNSFELWPKDLDVVEQMGLNSYRFSLEWSRIEPEPGLFSIAMLDHYKAMVEGCRQRGLTPIVTFNHFTTPRWFAARGGWTDAEAPELFGRFCERAARHFAALIGYAITLNEPNVISVLRNAFSQEIWAQFKPQLDAMSAAAARAAGSTRFVTGYTINVDDIDGYVRNLVAGHKAGRAAIKAVRPNLPVGVSLAMPDDQTVGKNSIRDAIREKTYGVWLEAARADDFLGVQNYERSLWDDKSKVESQPAEGDRNAAGGEVYPASLANAVRYAHALAGVPIIVTEHGVNTEDDAVRARLIPAALTELKKIMDEGVPVLGYLHWSLLDNFEWIFGYRPKYGLASVERSSFKRTLKPSAFAYGAIARRNSLED